MKFKINRDHFAAGLAKVQNIVSTRSATPILNNVLLNAQKDTLSLATTNLDLSMECSVKAEVADSGSITLPVRKLATIIKSLPNIEVEIESTDNYQVKISSGGSRFKIMGMDSSSFPQLPSISDSAQYSIDQTALLTMIKSVSYAQSTDANRHILNGIYFKFENKQLTLVATDGRRLGLISKDIENTDSSERAFILPAKSASELERVLGMGDSLSILFNENQVRFSVQVGDAGEQDGFVSQILLNTKLVEGNYPNFNQVIPKETVHRVKVDRELLLESLSRAALVASEKNHSIRLKLGKNNLHINGSSPELGESHESLAIEFDAPDVELAFNPQYLMDPLPRHP